VPNTHIHTPASSLIDALGRTIKTIDRLTSSSNISEQVVMQYAFDIRGNLLTVTDALGRTTFSHSYDLSNRPLKTTHIDGGTKYIFMDCMSKPLEMRDEKGALVLNSYDTLNRPVKVWARDKTGETVTVRQKTIYGDSAGLTSPENNNLKGKPYKVYDEAGLTKVNSYDFKGNPPEKIRQVIKDSEILNVFSGPPSNWSVSPFRVDWDTMTDSVLDATEFITSMEYDALNRVKKMTYPEDVDTERKIMIPTYNKGGALTKVQLKDTEVATPVTYVDRIAYNAKGQRILVAFGNGVMTRYRYDENNFRLTRMKTEKYTTSGLTYIPTSGTVRQNLAYEYDLSGNIISINDKTTDCGYGATPNELTRDFSYDPLYRLLTATGREKDSGTPGPYYDSYIPENPTATRGYTQNYTYDKLGNIQSLQHVATSGNFTRTFNYVTNKNKLNNIVIGSNTYSFVHDVNGNITSDDNGGSRFYEYDYADRIRTFRVQAGTSEPTQYAHYLYDGGGNRVKKIVRKQSGGYRTTVYIDGIFEYTKSSSYQDTIPELEVGEWIIGGEQGEQNTLHIMDDQSRIATRRIGDALDDSTPAIKYNIDDHLGSSAMQLDTTGAIISREEYYPFGETSFGSYGKKRYRFCGKEKDEESGLYYYGMRYYSAWTCRFMSVDPLAGKYPYLTPYQYASNDPIGAIDIDGLESTKEGGGEQGSNACFACKGGVKPGTNTTTQQTNSSNVPDFGTLNPSSQSDGKTETLDDLMKNNIIPRMGGDLPARYDMTEKKKAAIRTVSEEIYRDSIPTVVSADNRSNALREYEQQRSDDLDFSGWQHKLPMMGFFRAGVYDSYGLTEQRNNELQSGAIDAGLIIGGGLIGRISGGVSSSIGLTTSDAAVIRSADSFSSLSRAGTVVGEAPGLNGYRSLISSSEVYSVGNNGFYASFRFTNGRVVDISGDLVPSGSHLTFADVSVFQQGLRPSNVNTLKGSIGIGNVIKMRNNLLSYGKKQGSFQTASFEGFRIEGTAKVPGVTQGRNKIYNLSQY
jgi:RHS repeat-associated protein